MKNYLLKLKHILPTFVAITFGSVLGLGFLRWVFCIQFSVIEILEEMWEVFIPAVFPIIPITLWYRQRLRILSFKVKTEERRIFFQLLAYFTITPMLISSQKYLTTATGKLSVLENINEIEKTKKVRYYRINNFAVDSKGRSYYYSRHISGKRKQYLSFNLFLVMPIIKDTNELISQTPRYWFGVKFSKELSNRISEKAKNDAFDAFFQESEATMSTYNLNSINYFERQPISYKRQNYLYAIECKIQQKANANTVIFEPVLTKFEHRSKHTLFWFFSSFLGGIVILLLLLLWPRYSATQHKRFLAGVNTKNEDLVKTFHYLIPKNTHVVSAIFMNISVFVFILMLLTGSSIFLTNTTELLRWGANLRVETSHNQWWRLLTNIFVHGGIMHLLLSISGLLITAIFIEPLLGWKKFCIIFIVCGLCASITSIGWHNDQISYGANGAIFGIYGTFVGLWWFNAWPQQGKLVMFAWIGVYIFISLLWSLIANLDNAAHVGGFLCGIAISIIFPETVYKQEDQ
jgi:rhomboid protease GluP